MIVVMVFTMSMNTQTHFYGGSEWVVDGELGRRTYPGCWDMGTAVEYCRNDWEIPADAFLDNIKPIAYNEVQKE